MKTQGLRITFFILSFAMGIGFVAILNLLIFDQSVSEYNANAKTEPTDFNQSVSKNISNTKREGTEDIEINFKEFVDMENGFEVNIVITNYSSNTYIYKAFINSKEPEPISILAELKINGEKVNQMHCGTGLNEFELKAGEAKTFKYNAFNLSHYWKKRQSVQIGYHFRKKIVQDYQIFWSKNLPISDSIVDKLLKEQNQR